VNLTPGRRAVLRCPGLSRGETALSGRRITNGWQNCSHEQHRDKAIELPSPARPSGHPYTDRAGDQLLRTASHWQAAHVPDAIRGAAIPQTIVESCGVSFSGGGCEAFNTHHHCAPGFKVRWSVQSLEMKNSLLYQHSRAEFPSFRKVYRAEWREKDIQVDTTDAQGHGGQFVVRNRHQPAAKNTTANSTSIMQLFSTRAESTVG
jgi:hypothetical protein